MVADTRTAGGTGSSAARLTRYVCWDGNVARIAQWRLTSSPATTAALGGPHEAGTSGIQSNAYSTSVLQTLRKSVTKTEANGYPLGVFALHPTDWEAVELAVASVNAIEHLSLPFDPVARRLWGVPIAVSVAVPVGTAYTFAQGAVGLNVDSQGVSVTWSETSNADDWSRNLIRARCEGRYQVAVYQPLGVVQSDLTA